MEFVIRDPEKAGKARPSATNLVDCPCGKKFTPYRSYQKYCSDRCQERYGSGKSGRPPRKPYVVVECQNPECRKSFKTNDGKRRYCGPECYARAQALRLVAPHPQRCKNCGREFITSHAAKTYCGADCRREARRKRDEARTVELRGSRQKAEGGDLSEDREDRQGLL